MRAGFVAYLVAVHAAMAGLGLVLFLQHGPWLIAWELAMLLSLSFGVALFRHLWQPLELVGAGADLIEEGDFTCKFLPVGRREMDALVRVYNRMIDRLREERLRVQEQSYFMEKILAATPSGVVIFDLDDRVTMANPGAEGLLRVEGSQLIGQTLAGVGTELLPGIEALEDGQTKVIPVGRRQVRCLMSHYLDHGFQRRFVLLEELTEELRRAETTAHERIIRLLSHEVNNTVGATSSLLHSALNYGVHLPEEDRDDFDGALRIVISRTEQLSKFMSGFADVVHLPQPTLQPVDLCQMLEGTQALLEPEARARRIEWHWEVEEPLGPIQMDQAQMEQVFLNVLKNAQEAIGEDGRITVRLGREGGRPRVVVEDTGGGITEKDREQLFIPFFSTKENGQGIGLALVQEVLRRHGFDFGLEGRPGQGAQFTVVF